ncbi:hypothetical protein [Ktedonosporobacter rubrisoli]|uniref:hypothetical protein n=1 Tax=Ktedonosporobacter rubrisoli TaxID=2509675 RepID=UPI0013EEC565|nr:hypothetical protein [Ktedonosporobacter rubrisoli]
MARFEGTARLESSIAAVGGRRGGMVCDHSPRATYAPSSQKRTDTGDPISSVGDDL